MGRPLKVLFFVEPVVYRSNHRLLTNWVEVINRAAAASFGLLDVHLATSYTLLGHSDEQSVRGWCLPSYRLLESVGFDRLAYSRDVCLGDGSKNAALAEEFQKVRDAVDPDIVISWTENAYLRRTFESSKLLFTEFGPMPRAGFVQTIHLDPYGHQIGSVFDKFACPHWDEADDPAVEAWYNHWIGNLEFESGSSGMKDWIRTLPPSKSRKLIALQPTDWLTYEGAGVEADPLGLLAAAGCRAEPTELIIPQWHPAQSPPDSQLLDILCREYPAIVIPPASLRVGRSEAALLDVDEVITVSSNVALAGAFLGRSVQVIGQSKFGRLNTSPTESPRKRSDLVPVLASRLCRPVTSWTRERGGLADHIRSAGEWRHALFDRPELHEKDLNRFFVSRV